MLAISKPLEMGTTNYVAVFCLLRCTIVAKVSLYLPECSPHCYKYHCYMLCEMLCGYYNKGSHQHIYFLSLWTERVYICEKVNVVIDSITTH